MWSSNKHPHLPMNLNTSFEYDLENYHKNMQNNSMTSWTILKKIDSPHHMTSCTSAPSTSKIFLTKSTPEHKQVDNELVPGLKRRKCNFFEYRGLQYWNLNDLKTTKCFKGMGWIRGMALEPLVENIVDFHRFHKYFVRYSRDHCNKFKHLTLK